MTRRLALLALAAAVFAGCELTAPYRETRPPAEFVRIVTTHNRWDDGAGQLELTGLLQNESDRPIRDLVLYGEAVRYRGARFADADGNRGTGRATISYLGPHQLLDYTVVVDGIAAGEVVREYWVAPESAEWVFIEPEEE